MDELQVGDPAWLRTDVGPVIDADALRTPGRSRRSDRAWSAVAASLPAQARYRRRTLSHAARGRDRLHRRRLEREVFGPIIHVLHYRSDRLEALVDAINATGYGLTFGIHTASTAPREGAARVNAGNVYVNRNMIGAVVGVQPSRGGSGSRGRDPRPAGRITCTASRTSAR